MNRIKKEYLDLYDEEYRLSQEARKELSQNKTFDFYKKTENGWSEFQDYCFFEFIDSSLGIYVLIAELCIAKGIRHVYDIGCNIAYQAKIFHHLGITYTGIEIEKRDLENSPKGAGLDYINRPYPFHVKTNDKEHTAAISNLCLGYLIHPAKKAYEQIAKDFKYFCGIPGTDKISEFYKRFAVTETISVEKDPEIRKLCNIKILFAKNKQ